jgi:sulfur-carrier protein adenylyltransferase/sulfurtransferase
MDNMSEVFSTEELLRYSRHLNLPNFNLSGQKKLKDARVLVVGTGGLGAPMLQYLAASGVGTLGVVDFDVIDKSNLQRQVLFTTEDVGKLKTTVARERILAMNPHINVEVHNTQLNAKNALQIIENYDIVADGTDNFPTRYLVNDACVLSGKPNVYASIFQFEGQVSVFNLLNENGERGPNYRDIFPTPPPPGMVPSCAEGGVLGVLPGIIGSLQALEVLKLILKEGAPLSGELFVMDTLTFTVRKLKIRKDSSNPLSGEKPTQTELIDYEEFCGLKSEDQSVPEITIEAFRALEPASYQLIDVREPYEYEAGNMNGVLIPLGQLAEQINRIDTSRTVVIHCKSGARSAKAVKELAKLKPNARIYNLKGGIQAWAKAVNSSIAVV